MNPIILVTSSLEDAERIHGTLSEKVSVIKVVVEKKTSRMAVLKRRIRRYGLVAALGQALMVASTPFLNTLSQKRREELNRSLPRKKISETQIQYVSSINSDAAVEAFENTNAKAMLVYGTRLFSKKTLSRIHIPILNIHAGITPRYRGGHGAYWALAEGFPQFAGVTLHYIDEGIDTGEIIAQTIIPITKEDSFVTYPLLQLREGAMLARDFLSEGTYPQLSEQPEPKEEILSHPTLWEYIYRWITSGIH